MKGIKNILMLVLIGLSLSVAAGSYRTPTKAIDTDVGVMKVVKAVPVILNYDVAVTSADEIKISKVVSTILFSGSGRLFKNHIRTKKIYLLNCSIRQCSPEPN